MAKTATKIENENVEVVDISLLLFGLDRIKKEANQNLGENEGLKKELNSKIDSIVTEKEVKTINEKVTDLVRIISKNPEMGSSSEVGMIAKKIELATEELARQHPKEVEELKKEEFKNNFNEETKKINSKLSEDQLKAINDYSKLVAENSFNENILDGQKNNALEANKELFSPGRLENAWTDLKQTVNFLQKSPEEIKSIKEKYNSLKGKLNGIELPSGSKEARSFEKMMAAFNNPNTDQLFSRTRKYLGWADRVDKLTGGWLKKTVTNAAQRFVEKVGNQAIQEFATNALGTIAKEGFQKGFTTVLNGVLSGGVKKGVEFGIKTGAEMGAKAVIGTGAKVAAEAGAEAVIGTAGGAATGGILTIAMIALEAVKAIKKVGNAIAEKLGISSKKFFEENFGKIGGKIVGGLMFLVGLPAILMGMITSIVLMPIIIVVSGIVLGYQLIQNTLISIFVPPKGASNYEEVIDGNNDSNYENINYTGSAKTVGSYVWNGIIFYVFEGINGKSIKSVDRYDIGDFDPSSLGLVPLDYRKNCTYNGLSTCQLDKRIIPAYIAMIKAARESGELTPCQLNEDLKLNWGYRTKAQQDILWEKSKNPAKAAPPGSISEHRTGRGMDIRLNCGIGSEESFSSGYPIYKASSTFKWLLKNASKYGFYNYIDKKTGESAEPWHWSYNPPMPVIQTIPDSVAL